MIGDGESPGKKNEEVNQPNCKIKPIVLLFERGRRFRIEVDFIEKNAGAEVKAGDTKEKKD